MSEEMEWVKVARVAIKSLKLPGDIKDRMSRKHVKELAESIRQLGNEPGNPVWVQNGTRELVAGRDRIAAMKLLGNTHILARFGDFGPGDIERAERDENLRRRDVNREKLLAEAAKQEAAEIKAREKEEAAKAKASSGTDVPAKRGKSKTAKGKAREKVAAKAGIKAESVRKAEQRQKAKEKAAAEGPKPEKPPINLLGMDINKSTLTAVGRVVDLCRLLSEDSVSMLKTLSKHATHLPPAILERLREPIKAIGDEARAIMPTAICYECWGEGDEKCKLCKGAHYARYEQMKDVPKERLMPPPKNGVQDGAQA